MQKCLGATFGTLFLNGRKQHGLRYQGKKRFWKSVEKWPSYRSIKFCPPPLSKIAIFFCRILIDPAFLAIFWAKKIGFSSVTRERKVGSTCFKNKRASTRRALQSLKSGLGRKNCFKGSKTLFKF